jgi:hypothetical protein
LKGFKRWERDSRSSRAPDSTEDKMQTKVNLRAPKLAADTEKTDAARKDQAAQALYEAEADELETQVRMLLAEPFCPSGAV